MHAHDQDVAVGDDVTLHVRHLVHDGSAESTAARRPTLVFLHDSLGCIELWRDFPQRMAEATGCDALVYDRRGYGRSSPFPPEPRSVHYLEHDARVLHLLLDRSGVGEAIYFGHSDGGSIALVAAAMHPARVRALVTEGAHVFVEEITLAGIRDTQEQLRTTNLRDRLMRYHGDKTDGVTSAWIDTWLDPEFRSLSLESYLPRITAPLLAMQGEADEFGSEAQVEAIVRGTGGAAEPLMIAGVGHSPHKDAAELVLEKTVDFLRRHRAIG